MKSEDSLFDMQNNSLKYTGRRFVAFEEMMLRVNWGFSRSSGFFLLFGA